MQVMSEAARATVAELIAQSRGLPYGPGRVAVLEEAVRHADRHADVPAGYDARMELLDAAVMGGRGDLLVAHYPWCLAQFDRDPARFDEFQLLWRFKWVIWRAIAFPEITLPQIHGLFDEMTTRFRRFGAGERVLAKYRLSLAMHVGDTAAAAESFDEFLRQPRDSLSNCPACEADTIVDYHNWRGEHERAVDAAKNVVNGRLSCRLVPESTYATLLDSLFRLGDDERAVVTHRNGLRLSARSGDLGNLTKHVYFLAVTDNLSAAVRLFERFLPAAAHGYEPRPRFDFLLAGRFLCDRLMRSEWSRGVRVPPELVTGSRKTTSDVPALRAWLDAESRRAAKRFDDRNGTPRFADQIAGQDELHAVVRPVPVARD
jgi:hypothetical protein